jgi:NTE family protein
MKTTVKNVALVLSGGGARGLAHIGVIEELMNNGYTISSIAGTSIGSLIGGVYVSGKLPVFKEWICHIGKFDLLKLMDFAIYKNGFIKGEKVFKKLQDFIDDTDIENLNIPYSAVSVDIRKHKEIIFRSGNLVQAIRASVAIPTILRPLNFHGTELVDGGVLNPLPLDAVERTAGDIVVAVDLNSSIPYSRKHAPNGQIKHDSNYLKAKEFINRKWPGSTKDKSIKGVSIFDLITESIYTMQMKLTETAIEKFRPDILVSISKFSCEIYEYHRAEEIIEYGRKQFRTAHEIYLTDMKITK